MKKIILKECLCLGIGLTAVVALSGCATGGNAGDGNGFWHEMLGAVATGMAEGSSQSMGSFNQYNNYHQQAQVTALTHAKTIGQYNSMMNQAARNYHPSPIRVTPNWVSSSPEQSRESDVNPGSSTTQPSAREVAAATKRLKERRKAELAAIKEDATAMQSQSVAQAGAIFTVTDARDLKLLHGAEGAKMGNTTLPSGKVVPVPSEGMEWRVVKGQIVLGIISGK